MQADATPKLAVTTPGNPGPSFGIVACFDRSSDPLGNPHCINQLHRGQHHQEFLAAITNGAVRRRAEFANQNRSHPLQAEVARAVTVSIVEPLEMVDVHQDDRDHRRRFTLCGPQPAQFDIEVMTVRQAR